MSKSRFVRAAIAVTILLGVVFWNPEPVSFALRATFHTVLWPLEKLFSSTAFRLNDISEAFSSIGELKSENERLSDETLRLKAENAKLEFLKGENEALRKAAGVEVRKRFDLIASETISYGGESERGSLVIDKGSAQGIRTGMPVILGEGVLVGVVSETYPASAKVTLLTSSQSSIGGVTAEHGAQGVVRGQRGLGISFDMILQTDTIRSGDRVVTSGVGGNVPSGLFIGTVDQVRESVDRLSREATLLSPVDFSDLRFLSCIKEGE